MTTSLMPWEVQYQSRLNLRRTSLPPQPQFQPQTQYKPYRNPVPTHMSGHAPGPGPPPPPPPAPAPAPAPNNPSPSPVSTITSTAMPWEEKQPYQTDLRPVSPPTQPSTPTQSAGEGLILRRPTMGESRRMKQKALLELMVRGDLE
ncbi:hypothetical protein G7Y89_g841 [Cudoniella acicularis]|uniref:Uncharacterized protein n=1 Tax=Cudoniella acicularis TaxID=354080 RepID=A0A8H4W7Y4_9HELO|nr:hypothetical protein G7Y89_g841 [Cudoniella acicularis]